MVYDCNEPWLQQPTKNVIAMLEHMNTKIDPQSAKFDALVDQILGNETTAATPSEKNKAYRLLLDKIIYDRGEQGITLEVLYR